MEEEAASAPGLASQEPRASRTRLCFLGTEMRQWDVSSTHLLWVSELGPERDRSAVSHAVSRTESSVMLACVGSWQAASVEPVLLRQVPQKDVLQSSLPLSGRFLPQNPSSRLHCSLMPTHVWGAGSVLDASTAGAATDAPASTELVLGRGS